ncbi:MAG: hypothetical protein ABSH09_17505 [Bryobacteraceae bacterium]|jgi:hypothetical protein
MTPLTSTLADLTAAKLIAYYPPPPPGVPIVSASTNPSVYASDPTYLEQLNAQSLQKYAVDVPNTNVAATFSFACNTWEQNGKSPTLPAPPAYSVFDSQAFNQWWAQYATNLGTAPPLFFIKPAPLPPAPVILPAGMPPPPPPSYDGPIGAPVPNNPGVFNDSPNDPFPDGYVYSGPTGIYQKHVYSNPFTPGNTRVIWISLLTA